MNIHENDTDVGSRGIIDGHPVTRYLSVEDKSEKMRLAEEKERLRLKYNKAGVMSREEYNAMSELEDILRDATLSDSQVR